MTNRTPPRETVVGVFSTAAPAARGIAALYAVGFPPVAVGILMRNAARAAKLAARTGTPAGADPVPGGIPGAVAAALVSRGLPAHEARIYEEHYHLGRILVTVQTGITHYHAAWDTLRMAGAERIDFQPPAAGTPVPDPPDAARRPAPRATPGAGAPIRQGRASNASPNGYTGPRRPDEFNGYTPYTPAPMRPFEHNR